MATFIDGIVMSQRFRVYSLRTIAGVRSIAYRSSGDIRFDGTVVEDEECIGERFRDAWIQGSHSTKVRIASDGTLQQIKGNPGRYGRPENVWNHDLDGTVECSNRIMVSQGLMPFQAGEPVATTEVRHMILDGGRTGWATGGDLDKAGYAVCADDDGPMHEGARVWAIHVTRNYVAGSQADALAVINWLDGQSVARVKKTRLGMSTVVWGSLNYCQVEAYLKADELMAHCKGEIEREAMRQNPVYQWCRDNGVVRVEVKAAKDYLREAGLTWLGEWTMEKVIQLFESRTDVLHRVKCDLEEFDPAQLPSKVACTAAAWMRGEDVRRFMSRATFFRHAAILREYGIDIAEKRNVTVMPVKVKTIELKAAPVPEWYSMRAA